MPLRILQNTNEMSQPANTCEEKSFHSKLRSHQGASNHSDPRVRLKPSQTINDNPERNNLKWLKDIVDTECQEKIPEEIESLQNTGSANDGDIDASGDDTCDSSSPSQDASGESARKNDRTQFIVAYATYVNYQRESDYQINQLRRNLESLPPIHQKWLQSPPPEEDANWLSQNDRLTYMRNCTTYNYKLICDMLVSSVSFWSVPELKTSEGLKKELREVKCHPNDLHDFVVKDYKSKFNTEKVRSTLQQIVREWSEEYELERVQSYGIILQELKKRLPVDDSNWNQIRVLCPGSGLGRLPLEICLAGYESIANENSYFMMMMCQFILRKSTRKNQFLIFPWVHEVNNLINPFYQLRPVYFPDVLPGDRLPNSKFECYFGDFLELDNDYHNLDAICTCFFIDTASNIIEVIEKIYELLKPGGIWINLGPLLYHYSEINEMSLELTLTQILNVSRIIGFDIQNPTLVESGYANDYASILQVVYRSVFFVGVKVVRGSEVEVPSQGAR